MARRPVILNVRLQPRLPSMKTSNRHSAQDAIAKEYSQLAERYDTKWSFYVERTTRETLARLKLRPSEQLLDVGCGTGALLYRLSANHPVAHLSGVDAVAEMLAIARRRLPAAINLRQAWVEDLPFGAEQFDVVVSCNVFHYLRQPVVALREMERVLRPGGRLIITDWCDDYLACRLCGMYLRLFNRAHFKVYRERECIQLLNQAGHAVVDIDRYKINWLWGLMTARVAKAVA